jgi:hypothetical protein
MNTFLHSIPHNIPQTLLAISANSGFAIRYLSNSYRTYNFCDIERVASSSNGSVRYLAWEEELQAYEEGAATVYDITSSLRTLSLFSSQDILHLHRQFQRHLLGCSFPRKFEVYTLFLIDRYLRALREASIECLIGFYSPHTFGDHVLLCCAHALNIRSYILDTTSSTSSLPDPLIRIYDSKTGEHLRIGHNDAWQSMVAAQLDILFSRITSSGSPYSPTRLHAIHRTKRHNTRTILQVLSSSDIRLSERVNDALSLKAACLSRVKSSECKLREGIAYILMALHVEPEATTCPQGFKYYDQLVFLESVLAVARRFNLRIVLREHPNQLGSPLGGMLQNLHIYEDGKLSSRTEYFYKTLVASDYVAGFCNSVATDELLRRPEIVAVASINGALGLQAAVNSKVAITGPKNWYSLVKNVYPVDALLDLDVFPCARPLSVDEFRDSLAPYMITHSSILDRDSSGHTTLNSGFTEWLLPLSRS